jgi:tetratricopeptide (TPR) repeat protein
LTFYGERDLLGQSLSEEDWQYFIKSIDVVTDLDPYFFDPYLLTEGLLTWEAGKIVDANRLLEKGFKYRKNDWRIPYFIGFNYFYFLKNYENGSEYVMAASRLPGSPSYLPNLAARLAYYGEKSETAILFLREMLGETQDPKLLSSLEIRLLALERAAILEKLVTKFVSEQGRELRTMRELVEKGYIDEIPEDPYGGKWGILPNGRVFSTSRFVPVIPDESSATD